MAKNAETKKVEERVVISPPQFQTAAFRIRGISALVQNRFGPKATQQMRDTQEAGEKSRKGKKRTAKDFDAMYRDSMHISTQGWNGIPAAAFRSAMIDACRVCGFHMTMAKMSVFVIADGIEEDGTPLVRITKGKPRKVEHVVRVKTTTDIHARAMFDPGWEAVVRAQYDADQFELADVGNLLSRAGIQVGVQEGRPFSKDSHGMGWGQFEIIE